MQSTVGRMSLRWRLHQAGYKTTVCKGQNCYPLAINYMQGVKRGTYPKSLSQTPSVQKHSLPRNQQDYSNYNRVVDYTALYDVDAPKPSTPESLSVRLLAGGFWLQIDADAPNQGTNVYNNQQMQSEESVLALTGTIDFITALQAATKGKTLLRVLS